MKTFGGGAHIPDNKQLSENISIEQMPLVSDYYVALSQHIGKPAELVVEAGQTVVEGQLLAKASSAVSANIHSPVCGEISGIEKRKNPQGVETDYVHIKANGNCDEFLLPPLEAPSKEQISERIAEAGIVGLGGAGFPLSVKLRPSKPVDTLIINAAECEPYLNCDNRLLVEHADKVIEGARLIAQALNVTKIFVGIEANKMQAYKALFSVDGVADEKSAQGGDIAVVLLKPKYPQGAEKMLIRACLGRIVPIGGLPADVGCVVNNVATAYAVWDAVENGRPLYKRTLSVSGSGIATPRNLEVRVGTPISDIIEFCGGLKDNTVKLLCGGPMMGFSLMDDETCVTKTFGGLLALVEGEANTLLPTPCINCGRCVRACPMHLMPVYIDYYATVGDTENAVRYGALNCFECGTCAYVCPARRPIVQSVRLTKQRAKKR